MTSRGDGWMLIGKNAAHLFQSFQNFGHEIKTYRTISDLTFTQNFEKMATRIGDNNPVLWLLKHVSTCFNSVSTKLLMEQVQSWVTFLQDDRFSVTLSPMTQLGIVSRHALPASTVLCIGKVSRVYVGSRSYSVLIKGFRWSVMHHHVVLGPLSLLNHACRMHCNVDSSFIDDDVLIIRGVEQDSELLVEYADEDYLALTMGFTCANCIKGEENWRFKSLQ